MLRTSLSLLILSVLILGGCSKPEEKKTLEPASAPQASAVKPAGAKPIDPCALLTQEEASEILGEKAGAPERTDSGFPLGMRICQWTPADELRMGLIQISVTQTEAIDESMRKNGYTAERLFRESKSLSGGQAIPGIGDDAYSAGGGLTFMKNGIEISVSAGSGAIMQKGEQGLPTAKKLAEKVVGRI